MRGKSVDAILDRWHPCRQGVGRALMERARSFAQDNGAAGMALSTAVDNGPAQALYESLGWLRDEDFYTYELVF